MNKTVSYYNTHATQYAADTVSADMRPARNLFLELLPKSAVILDLGCGSGRDAKAFLDAGYSVEAVDGSAKLCKIASAYTGIAVRQMYFEELDFENRFDGVWACASVLHLLKGELADVMRRIFRALKEDGILYVSFKYGAFEGERDGRYFTYFTETSFAAFLQETGIDFVVERQWITDDVRPKRGKEQWLNILLRRVTSA